MYTIDEMENTFKQSFIHLRSLLSIYNDEIKEYGEPKSSTIRYFNSLFLQLQKATDCAKAGLDGKFPWEVNINE